MQKLTSRYAPTIRAQLLSFRFVPYVRGVWLARLLHPPPCAVTDTVSFLSLTLLLYPCTDLTPWPSQRLRC